jgi:deoxyribonuclease-4
MGKSSFRFGTVGSPKSTPAKPGGSVGAVSQIAALKLNALELGWVQSVRVSPETCSAIKSLATELNVAISVHAPYFINLNADEEEWPKSRKRLMDAAYYGYLAGATDIIFHPGSYFGKLPSEIMGNVMDRLNDCVIELKKQNTNVCLRPETMGKSAMLGSLEDTLVMSQIEGVQPCLDFAHLHARPGNGTVNSYDEWSAILDLYGTKLGNESLKSLHIHLSGIEYGPKGEKNHLPVQESDLDFKGLFTSLASHICSGRIVCESPILEEDAAYLKNTWLEISGQD